MVVWLRLKRKRWPVPANKIADNGLCYSRCAAYGRRKLENGSSGASVRMTLFSRPKNVRIVDREHGVCECFSALASTDQSRVDRCNLKGIPIASGARD